MKGLIPAYATELLQPSIYVRYGYEWMASTERPPHPVLAVLAHNALHAFRRETRLFARSRERAAELSHHLELLAPNGRHGWDLSGTEGH